MSFTKEMKKLKEKKYDEDHLKLEIFCFIYLKLSENCSHAVCIKIIMINDVLCVRDHKYEIQPKLCAANFVFPG